MWLTFAVIACTIIAFATERWSIEGISLAALAALLVIFTLVPQPVGTDVVSAAELLVGFANPALITVLALLVIGQALFNTDALDAPARFLSRLGGGNAKRTIAVLLVTAGVTSAFLNNTPVIVMFIPIIVAIAAQRNFSPSSALLPLSFVGILGGMTTLIGSSTNLLVAGVAERYGTVIGFFDFTAFGAILAVIGFLYITFIMPILLPDRRGKDSNRRMETGRQFVAQITVTPNHVLEGQRSRAGIFPMLDGMTVRSIFRDGESMLPPFDEIALEPGDIVNVAGTRRALVRALSTKAFSLPEMPEEDRSPERQTDNLHTISEEFILAEAVVAPGSRYAGRTVEASKIRATFGTAVLGLQRRSTMSRGIMRQTRLEPGDTLLVGGLPQDIEALRTSRELLMLERSAVDVPLRSRAPRAIAIFACVVLSASVFGIPIVAAALIGAYATIASGCLSIRQAAAAFDRQIFMMVGASLAAAVALERTGGANFIAQAAVDAFSGFGPAVILSVLFIVTAILTNVLSNNATAVLFTPISINLANTLGVDVQPFIWCIIFAANCSFATPIGYQTNLLVLGPGRYRFNDYLRTGIPLILVLWLSFSIIAPMWFDL